MVMYFDKSSPVESAASVSKSIPFKKSSRVCRATFPLSSVLYNRLALPSLFLDGNFSPGNGKFPVPSYNTDVYISDPLLFLLFFIPLELWMSVYDKAPL